MMLQDFHLKVLENRTMKLLLGCCPRNNRLGNDKGKILRRKHSSSKLFWKNILFFHKLLKELNANYPQVEHSWESSVLSWSSTNTHTAHFVTLSFSFLYLWAAMVFTFYLSSAPYKKIHLYFTRKMKNSFFKRTDFYSRKVVAFRKKKDCDIITNRGVAKMKTPVWNKADQRKL